MYACKRLAKPNFEWLGTTNALRESNKNLEIHNF